MTISCHPDGRPPQPVRPWKSGRVHLAEGSNVVVLQLPYFTEFGRDSRKFASCVRKYGTFSHFLTHLVVYGGQGKKQILSSLSTANVYHAGVYLDFLTGGVSVVSGWPCQRGRSTFKCDTNVHCVNDKQYMKYRQPLD